jgi:hypothetical protein
LSCNEHDIGLNKNEPGPKSSLSLPVPHLSAAQAFWLWSGFGSEKAQQATAVIAGRRLSASFDLFGGCAATIKTQKTIHAGREGAHGTTASAVKLLHPSIL